MADIGHNEIDNVLSLMENDVKELYSVAADDLEKKVADYWRRHELKDKVKKAQLDAGEITQEEYNRWRYGQVMIGQRWEEQLSVITAALTNAHSIAETIVDGYLPDVFALSADYGAYEVDMLVRSATNGARTLNTIRGGISWTMYDRNTVIRLLRDRPDILPPLHPQSRMAEQIAQGKVRKWEERQVRSQLLQGVIQGESNVEIAQRMRNITNADMKSVMRYARTATTSAECAGRIESYMQAQDMGIQLEQQWVATLDNRTRHSHRLLDGVHVPVGEYFVVNDEAMKKPVKIRYPGQFSTANDSYKVPPDMIWNCRCTIVAMLTGIPELEADNDISNLTLRDTTYLETSYEEWKKGHPQCHSILKAQRIGAANRAMAIKEYREAARRLGV